MYRKAIPLFLTCETPLHAGSGDNLGVVDLPIQREKHTGFPKIEGSSLKGAIREAFETLYKYPFGEELEDLVNNFNNREEMPVIIQRLFGYDPSAHKGNTLTKLESQFTRNGDKQTEFAGALTFTDARLLLFPVKSMKGVFAWITCPKALEQFCKDMMLPEQQEQWGIPAGFGESGRGTLQADGCLVSAESGLTFESLEGTNVVLEEYAFSATTAEWLKGFGEQLGERLFSDLPYWKAKAATDIVVLSDDDFRDFVNLSTEVITRTKINNETGTVQQGALVTEEYLPAESVLYSLVLASPEFTAFDKGKSDDEVMDFFQQGIRELPIVQLGGNATLGKGLLRTKTLGGADA